MKVFVKTLTFPLLSVVLAACATSVVQSATYKATIMCEQGGILTLENTTDFITTCYHYLNETGICGYGFPYTSYSHPKWSHFSYGVMVRCGSTRAQGMDRRASIVSHAGSQRFFGHSFMQP